MARGAEVISIALTVDADYEAFQASAGVAAIVQLNPRELATIHINLDAVGVIDNFEWLLLAGTRMAIGGDWDAVADASNLDLETAVHPTTTDDEMVGIYVVATNGGEAGEFRLITDSTAADDGITVDHAFTGVPSAGELYDLYRMSVWDSGIIVPLTTVVVDNPQNVITSISGPDFFVVLGRAAGATDAHLAYMTYQKDGVSI